MIFEALELSGSYLIRMEPIADGRGFFARSYCLREFGERGLATRWVQANVLWSPRRHTLRGLHFQTVPSLEAKLVRCTAGAIFDVIVDMRPASVTYLGWTGAELTAENRMMMYAPEGCAHGFLTLTDDTEVTYDASEFYDPTAVRGVRWDDPSIGVTWPAEPAVISEDDRTRPSLELRQS